MGKILKESISGLTAADETLLDPPLLDDPAEADPDPDPPAAEEDDDEDEAPADCPPLTPFILV